MKHLKTHFIKESLNLNELYDYLQEIEKNKERVPDGIYDISDIEFFNPNIPTVRKWVKKGTDPSQNYEDLPNAQEILSTWKSNLDAFVEKYPNFLIARAYATEYALWVATIPTKKIKNIGSGFNYGSTNIIDDCPKRILILAEND